MRHRISWVLVADFGRAFALTDAAHPRRFSAVADFAFDGPHLVSRQIGTDKSGRVFRAAGVHARSAVGEADALGRQEARRFLRRVIDALARRHDDGEFSSLVVVAPPRALGEIRACLPKRIADVITAEISADLTKSSPADISRAIAEHVTVSGLASS